jgi:UDP-N-acetylmuramate dehydrogenase
MHGGTMRIFHDEPLSLHTTMRVGGNADHYIVAKTIEGLKNALKIAARRPVFVIGGGSNLIVRDKGFRGVVIEPAFSKITVSGTVMKVQAGATVQEIIDFAIAHNLSGVECLAGIPGRLGGVICMNAGYTKPISSLVKSVMVMNYDGKITKMLPDKLKFGHRSSIFLSKKLIVLSAELQLKRGHCKEIVEMHLQKRAYTQPIEYPSCGSVFKKTNLFYYQGYGNERAEVRKSFIINLGGAKAADVLEIIKKIQQESNFELEAEIIGEE